MTKTGIKEGDEEGGEEGRKRRGWRRRRRKGEAIGHNELRSENSYSEIPVV